MTELNRQILLVSRPRGEVTPDNFALVETPLAPLAAGQVRVRNHYLSLDPYMRGRMSEAKSYAEPQPLNQVMIGGTAGEVVESNDARFAPGDKVIGMLGWQQYGTCAGAGLRKVDDAAIPLSAYLGVVGMPGVAAWYGLFRILMPQAGRTLVVSAAAGAVGGIVGQLAKRVGCRVVGIAGGVDKCRYVVDTLGFDACIDYKEENFAEAFKAALPDGIDMCFENVGGVVFDATLARMNAFGRVALCGLIAGYNGEPAPLNKASYILRSRLLIQGFIVTEHMEVWPQALQELSALVAQKQLRYRESIAQGLENAPQAFIGLLKGQNFGKQLVKLI